MLYTHMNALYKWCELYFCVSRIFEKMNDSWREFVNACIKRKWLLAHNMATMKNMGEEYDACAYLYMSLTL